MVLGCFLECIPHTDEEGRKANERLQCVVKESTVSERILKMGSQSCPLTQKDVTRTDKVPGGSCTVLLGGKSFINSRGRFFLQKRIK